MTFYFGSAMLIAAGAAAGWLMTGAGSPGLLLAGAPLAALVLLLHGRLLGWLGAHLRTVPLPEKTPGKQGRRADEGESRPRVPAQASDPWAVPAEDVPPGDEPIPLAPLEEEPLKPKPAAEPKPYVENEERMFFENDTESLPLADEELAPRPMVPVLGLDEEPEPGDDMPRVSRKRKKLRRKQEELRPPAYLSFLRYPAAQKALVALTFGALVTGGIIRIVIAFTPGGGE
jgi:hypothetical protein